MQSYLKYREYYNRKAKASPSNENDYCFILQPIADHQGSKIPFREYRWTGSYVVEKVLPNENYIVRELNSNKTQTLHRIRLRKFELNTVLEDIRPEGNLQPDDVNTWETNFGEFPDSAGKVTIPIPPSAADTSTGLADAVTPDEIFTDVDLRSTEPHEMDDSDLPERICSNRTNEPIDDQQSSGGTILSCPKY